MTLKELFKKYEGLENDLLEIKAHDIDAWRRDHQTPEKRKQKAKEYREKNAQITNLSINLSNKLTNILGLNFDILKSPKRSYKEAIARHILRRCLRDYGLTYQEIGYLEHSATHYASILHSMKVYDELDYCNYKINGLTVTQVLNMLKSF